MAFLFPVFERFSANFLQRPVSRKETYFFMKIRNPPPKVIIKVKAFSEKKGSIKQKRKIENLLLCSFQLARSAF